jgi:hypothetical protein
LGEKRAIELVKDNVNFYLNRGHLAANADFLFNSQQGEFVGPKVNRLRYYRLSFSASTFWLTNAAPQVSLERRLRHQELFPRPLTHSNHHYTLNFSNAFSGKFSTAETGKL